MEPKNTILTETQRKLVTDNLNLVYNTYHNTYPFLSKHLLTWEEDLIQEGMLGLCKAALDFNPELNNQFSTFAVPCIRHQMGMLIRKIRNDFMVDSFDEILEDEDGRSRLDLFVPSIISPEEIYASKEEKELVLQIIQGAPKNTYIVFSKVLQSNRRPVDIWIDYFSDRTYSYVNELYIKGVKRIKNILYSVNKKEIPQSEDYISQRAYEYDIRQLWKSRNPTTFQRNQKYLKGAN